MNRYVVLGACLGLFSSAVVADLRIHKEGRKDKKQYCYTDLVVRSNGAYKAKTTFSNGKKIDGDHFWANMIVFDMDKKPLIVVRHAAGVGAALSGGATERRVESIGKTDPGVLARIERRGTKYQCSGTNKIPDKDLAEAVVKIIEILL
ncbi:MAG: hypothetical protein EPO25_10205 [Gammaproteobacteria bacterium]|nr:MAG: hypothetical protein EPO25_10205 [Gammaproteobacteria bacterium]